MIVVWTPIEIAGKWGILRQPWLLLKPEALLVFFGGLALGTWGLWRAQRRPELILVPVENSAPARVVDREAKSRAMGHPEAA